MQLHHLCPDSETNNIWAATNKGLLQLHLPRKGIEIIPIPEEFSEPNNVVTAVVKNSDLTWILTRNNLVFQYANGFWKKIHRLSDNEQGKALLFNEHLYLTTTKGIYRWDNSAFEKLNLPNFEPDDSIVKVVKDTVNNEVWILYRHKIQKYRLTAPELNTSLFSNPKEFWTENLWNDLQIDSKGTVWLAGWMPKGFGICRYNRRERLFEDISSSAFNNDRNLFVGDYYNRINVENQN